MEKQIEESRIAYFETQRRVQLVHKELMENRNKLKDLVKLKGGNTDLQITCSKLPEDLIKM